MIDIKAKYVKRFQVAMILDDQKDEEIEVMTRTNMMEIGK